LRRVLNDQCFIKTLKNGRFIIATDCKMHDGRVRRLRAIYQLAGCLVYQVYTYM